MTMLPRRVRAPHGATLRAAAILLAAAFSDSTALAQPAAPSPPAPAVFVRFQMAEPAGAPFFVRFHTRLHNDPWYSKTVTIPEGAEGDNAKRVPAGAFTPWTDVTALTHGRLQRCGGVAEFSCGEAQIVTAAGPGRSVRIELATAADEAHVVKRLAESAAGDTVMFLVSRDLEKDAADLETGTQMTRRHLAWAREATGGRRVAPRKMMICTGIWGSPDAGLTATEAEALALLGFNVVGGTGADVLRKFDFGTQDHLWADFGPAITQDDARRQVETLKAGHDKAAAGDPDEAERARRTKALVFGDEIRAPAVASPPAVAAFRRYLAERGIDPASLGATRLDDVEPINTWKEYEARAKTARAAANRLYYHTCRFVQASATERLKWLTDAHRGLYGPRDLPTAVLPADHPYFGGNGLGGGDFGWGDIVACDWFDLARRRAVDLMHVEDWLGLQYMYGPYSTWEGFQLLGFQCSIFRSASRGGLPILALLTPGDSRNVQLKAFSSLAQGAKHFWFWHFGPTFMSTENYWSDIRGEYDGVARVVRCCAAAEDLLLPGRPRPTRVALLYSISSDIWKPYGYAPMLERRLTYFSLVHRQYLVDLLAEEDVAAGRLDDYGALYVTDPCVSRAAVEAIARWVEKGGALYGSCAAAGRDEYNEPQPGLSAAFGIAPGIAVTAIPGRYNIRGALNDIAPQGVIGADGAPAPGATPAEGPPACRLPALGVRVAATPTSARVAAAFDDGSPAVFVNRPGRGYAVYTAACPALAYGREAKFVRDDLRERWPPELRAYINHVAVRSGAPRVIECSAPVVEAGVFESERGIAVPLANFTYEPIPALQVTLRCPARAAQVTCASGAPIRHESVPDGLRVTLPLELSEIILVRWR